MESSEEEVRHVKHATDVTTNNVKLKSVEMRHVQTILQ